MQVDYHSKPLHAVTPKRQDSTSGVTRVIGIGNILMRDDGAGVHAVRRLEALDLPVGVELVDGGTLSFTLLETVETTDHLIIVDAAELGAEPGTIQAFHDAEMDAYLGNSTRPSVHEVNLLDVLTAARIRGNMPRRYSLIGIQPERIEWGQEPSARISQSIDHAVCRIREILESAS